MVYKAFTLSPAARSGRFISNDTKGAPMTTVLMPKATAVWLVDNTALTFDQIADFCGLHPLEVKGIADGDVATGIRGADPIANGQLTRDEIEKAEKNSDYRMKAHVSRHVANLQTTERKGARYTPVSRRQDRPDAIAWMVRNHPEVPDSQIGKLLGTTKSTIEQVRTRAHWNSTNIKPVDPVTLGLCTQIELDALVRKWSAKKEKLLAEARMGVEEGPAIRAGAIGAGLSVEYGDEEGADEDMGYAAHDDIDPNSVFGPSPSGPTASNLGDDFGDEDEA